MVLTMDIPDKLHRKIEAEKRRTGLSKSYIVRRILSQHYEQQTATDKKSAA